MRPQNLQRYTVRLIFYVNKVLYIKLSLLMLLWCVIILVIVATLFNYLFVMSVEVWKKFNLIILI